MRVHTAIIGGGQAGLAMSASLTDQGIDHVVLERGRIANAWHTERWDSLRLLSPNRMTRLPGHQYDGPDPDGYMRASEFATFLDDYAARIDAPVEEQTAVHAVRCTGDHFTVTTATGRWTADAVVVATGANARPAVPRFASRLTHDVAQVTPVAYKRPEQLPDGNVLVVGASSSGAQLASELRATGREVVLAVGRHSRLPRRYRDADSFVWLDRAGVLDDRASAVHDLEHARHQPSIQLVGSNPPRDLDLNTLQDEGVRLAGHLVAVDGTRLTFADDLAASVEDSEARLHALLGRIDAVAGPAGVPPDRHPLPIRVPSTPERLDVRAEGITSVIWATGFTRWYP
jgi:putative flavoprotein involved in K+ transport